MQKENTTAIARLENQTERRGYKKTKLGWIPEEWSTPTIPEVFQFLRTTSFSRNQMNYDENDGVYCIHYGDIHATYQRPILDFDENSEIPKINNDVELPSNIDLLEDGDLIIADASEDYEGIGTAIELTNLNGKEVLSGLHTFAFRDYKSKTVQGFRSYLLKNPQVKKALKTIATGSKVYGVSKGNLEKFRIILPTSPEQQKIAKILSTWETAIATQEMLITAKETIKKGLMQVLLTGEKRFEGFEGEWKEVKLGSCSSSYSGGTPSRSMKKYYQGNIPWIKSGDLNQETITSVEENISEEALSNSSAKIVEKGTLLLAMYGATAGVVAITNIKGAINQAILAIITANNLDKIFLYHLLNLKMPHFVHRLVQGGQPNLSGSIVKKLKIGLPILEEQQKIALVLSEVDKEIELQKQQLARLQDQKRGLMQRLLTGEIRVKI